MPDSSIAFTLGINPKDVGIDPDKLFEDRSSTAKVDASASSVGIVPVSRFFASDNDVSNESNPNEVGMELKNTLLFNDNVLNFAKLFSQEGTLPVRLL